MKVKKVELLVFFVCINLLSLHGQNTSTDKNTMSEAYWKLWNPTLQAKIDQNIEKYRKADALLILKGLPQGTEVKIEQQKHYFEFGANIFSFDQLGSIQLNEKYKEVFGTLLNSATIPFYWKTFEPNPGKPRYKASFEDTEDYWNKQKGSWTRYNWSRPSLDIIIQFCESKNIHMHGHPVIWGNMTWNHPAWVPKDSDKVQEMETLFNKRITEICTYYRGRIPSLDIVNESVDPEMGKPRYGLVPDDYTFKSFKLAEEIFPSSVKFCINDSWRSVYPPFIRDLNSREAKIDVVGLQMHIFNSQDCLDVAKGKTVFSNNT